MAIYRLPREAMERMESETLCLQMQAENLSFALSPYALNL